MYIMAEENSSPHESSAGRKKQISYRCLTLKFKLQERWEKTQKGHKLPGLRPYGFGKSNAFLMNGVVILENLFYIS